MFAQDPLAVAQLGLEAEQRTLSQLLVEVGDQADRVGQLGAFAERAAALVVDEDEVDPRRGSARRPARRPGCAGARSCRRRWCRRSARGDRRPTRSTSSGPSSERAKRRHQLGPVLGCAASARAARRRRPHRGPAAWPSATGSGERPAGQLEVGVLKAGQTRRAVARGGLARDPQISTASLRSPGWGRKARALAGLVGELDHGRAGRRADAARAGDDDARTCSPARSSARPAAPRPSISPSLSSTARIRRSSCSGS